MAARTPEIPDLFEAFTKHVLQPVLEQYKIDPDSGWTRETAPPPSKASIDLDNLEALRKTVGEEWDANLKIHEGFIDRENYIAWRCADASGSVQLVGEHNPDSPALVAAMAVPFPGEPPPKVFVQTVYRHCFGEWSPARSRAVDGRGYPLEQSLSHAVQIFAASIKAGDSVVCGIDGRASENIQFVQMDARWWDRDIKIDFFEGDLYVLSPRGWKHKMSKLKLVRPEDRDTALHVLNGTVIPVGPELRCPDDLETHKERMEWTFENRPPWLEQRSHYYEWHEQATRHLPKSMRLSAKEALTKTSSPGFADLKKRINDALPAGKRGRKPKATATESEGASAGLPSSLQSVKEPVDQPDAQCKSKVLSSGEDAAAAEIDPDDTLWIKICREAGDKVNVVRPGTYKLNGQIVDSETLRRRACATVFSPENASNPKMQRLIQKWKEMLPSGKE